MEIIAAVMVGIGLGWMLGRRRRPAAHEEGGGTTRRAHRPTRKQRAILETLPPDRPLPTIEDLVAEELEETGAGGIAGAAELAPPVALKVFRRDRPGLGEVAVDRLRFTVADGVAPAEATADDVTLVVDG